MAEIITTLGLLKTTSEVFKEARGLARESKREDLAEKLFDVYQRLTELVEENRSLREEISTLKNAEEIGEQLSPRDNQYWLPREGLVDDGPFCTACWDVDKRLVRLHKGFLMGSVQYFCCPHCDKSKK